ncbi:unnamed protein product [Heligmosomoides polygyrus]|uniref:Uncharacterized protein n=1 Tax=Heligmosomoides polygyrus TaxID=6339 RepID=A0A183FTI3_HELPZ|nr:unnamed protein product [Heligmosomoides polygyrus]
MALHPLAGRGTRVYSYHTAVAQHLRGLEKTCRYGAWIPQNLASTSYNWDSFGHESGILTGDGDSDGECTTPKPRRRMDGGAFSSMKISKEQCEFPLINVCGAAEKRRYSMTEKSDSGPIASRLRSNNARRAPVRLLINKPYSSTSGSGSAAEAAPSARSSDTTYPAPKRNRCNSWRPCLDLEKMIQTRISNETSRNVSSKRDHSTREN